MLFQLFPTCFPGRRHFSKGQPPSKALPGHESEPQQGGTRREPWPQARDRQVRAVAGDGLQMQAFFLMAIYGRFLRRFTDFPPIFN